jgi:(1->4)-alpha-D-glucan 1-alpha-D-glucosylmutase
MNVLSEMPREWAKSLRRWSRMNKRRKTMLDGFLVPTANEEVIFYQAMLGVWPLEPFDNLDKNSLHSRLEEFFLKAAKEAKTETNWLSPNEGHESALRRFVSSVVTAPVNDPFIADFLRLHKEIAFLGACNSCSQLLLKMSAPGIPDFYQGNELWNFCLTDPDNRQPVDFRRRITSLENLKSQGAEPPISCIEDLLNDWPSGRLKLHLTTRVLNFRRSHPALFSSGSYLPLSTIGTHPRSVFAFARHFEGQWLIVAVPRLLRKVIRVGASPLGKIWGATALEIPADMPCLWQNVLTNEQIGLSLNDASPAIPIAQLFRHLPFAVLVNTERSH